MKNYYRQFVTLLQERPGYAMPGKQAVGRIVIEAREDMGRATVYIQDLSPQNSYKLAFINKAGDANMGVVLGSIIVDERGRYEGKFEFDRTNIGGSRITCEGIDACVVFFGGGDEEFAAPLAGYRLTPFSWRVNLSFPDGKEDSPILEVKRLEEAKEEAQKEASEEIAEETNAEEIEMDINEKILELKIEEVPPSTYDFIIEEPAIKESSMQAEQKDEQGSAEISELFQNGSIVEIFSNSSRFPRAQWVVTTQQEIEAQSHTFGQIGNEILKNSLVKECCQKHKHVLLGRNANDTGDTYILGIPDIYDITMHGSEHEFNNLFDSFKMCNPSDPVKGAHGYWLKQL